MRLHDRARLSARSPDHLVIFALSGNTEIDCRMAGKRLCHTLQVGSIALLPAGADSHAETAGPVDSLVLRVAASRVAVGAAERTGRATGLVERLSGRDDSLMRLAASLFAEMRADYINGPLFWNEAADQIIERLLDAHVGQTPKASGPYLPVATVDRVADYIRTNVADPLDVATLARVAGVSQYHFSRLFARSVGMTPHRYVTKIRLETAVSLVRSDRLPPAEAALATGFAGQSHLSRWVKRVHGTTLSRIAA